MTPAFSFDNITRTFVEPEDRSQDYSPLADATLSIGAGEFVAMVGPTGCGKSTLLKIGAGLLEPTSGTVRVFGEPRGGVDPRIGYISQAEALAPARTALENVIAGLEARGDDRDQARRLGEQWLARVGLEKSAGMLPYQLSGGMRKRVALAQTLILDPEIILMDEPFSALDFQTRYAMEKEVLQIWSAQKKSILLVTYDLDEAIAMSDRVVVLGAGPGSRPVCEFVIDLPRPRDPLEVRTHPRFIELHAQIEAALAEEERKQY